MEMTRRRSQSDSGWTRQSRLHFLPLSIWDLLTGQQVTAPVPFSGLPPWLAFGLSVVGYFHQGSPGGMPFPGRGQKTKHFLLNSWAWLGLGWGGLDEGQELTSGSVLDNSAPYQSAASSSYKSLSCWPFSPICPWILKGTWREPQEVGQVADVAQHVDLLTSLTYFFLLDNSSVLFVHLMLVQMTENSIATLHSCNWKDSSITYLKDCLQCCCMLSLHPAILCFWGESELYQQIKEKARTDSIKQE